MVSQPARAPTDGAVSVTRVERGLIITVENGGVSRSLELGDFNAWRVFGMLAMMLEISLPTKLMKQIKL